jgi:hypothetical protein
MRLALLSLVVSLLTLVVAGGRDAHADPPAPPPEHAALYAELQQKLDDFEGQLDAEWDGGSGHGRFAATLSSANGNKSAALLHPFNWARMLEQLDAYEEMGVELVKLDMEYPVLTPAFHTFLAANPPVFYPDYAYTVSDFIGTPTSFYNRLFDEIRDRGFDIWVEHSSLFASYSPTPPTAYFADMRTAGVAATRSRYGQERAIEEQMIVAELAPDYFTLVEEPETQNDNFGYFPGPIPLYTEDLWRDFVQGSAQNIINTVPGSTTLLGAGSGTWDGPGYIQRFAPLPQLDFIDIHIYPIETDFEDYYQNALDWADYVRSVDPDKRLLIGETWLYKVSEDEIISGLPYDEILARDVYSFWEPLDKQFHEIMFKLVHHKGFDAIAPFWASYYFAYLTHGDPELEGLGNIELLALAGQEAIPNIASVTLNGNGATFQEIISREPDADGDGTPDSTDTGDSDADLLADNVESACGSLARDPAARPERIDGAFDNVDDDEDMAVDEALPGAASAFDCDGDGFTGSAEAGTPLCGNTKNEDSFDDAVIDDGCPGGPAQAGTFSEAQFNIGLTDQDPCGTTGWADDFVSGGIPNSTNRVTITDLTSFVAPTYRLNTRPDMGAFNKRWDLKPGPSFGSNFVQIDDLTALIAGPSGYPAMLGGVRAFGGPVCPWAP